MAVRTSSQPQRAAYEIYEELDLGPGGYAFAPATETRRGVQKAIRRKLEAEDPIDTLWLPEGCPAALADLEAEHQAEIEADERWQRRGR